MARPKPLHICDDTAGKHVWAEPFRDGDTCACGRFYLDLHPVQGFVAEVRAEIQQTTPAPATEASE